MRLQDLSAKILYEIYAAQHFNVTLYITLLVRINLQNENFTGHIHRVFYDGNHIRRWRLPATCLLSSNVPYKRAIIYELDLYNKRSRSLRAFHLNFSFSVLNCLNQ
jgi:hypothetical protein